MKRALLFLCVTAAIAAVTSLAYVSVARAEDEGGAVTCYPSADDVLVQSDAVGGWGGCTAPGPRSGPWRCACRSGCAPTTSSTTSPTAATSRMSSTSGEWPTGRRVPARGTASSGCVFDVAWYANGWHDAYTTSNVAWACTG